MHAVEKNDLFVGGYLLGGTGDLHTVGIRGNPALLGPAQVNLVRASGTETTHVKKIIIVVLLDCN